MVLGGEGGIVVGEIGLFARAAYGTQPSGSAYSKITYGGSLSIAEFSLDYAYQERDLLGLAVHRFGFRLTL